MQLRATRCLRISPINTTIISTAVPRRTNRGSGNLLRRYFLLDGAFAQARSVPSARGRMESVCDPDEEHHPDDRGRSRIADTGQPDCAAGAGHDVGFVYDFT